MGDVLVRLYGSYQYFYADPVKCRSEFEITLKENGGCYSEMFVEALEQDLPQSKSGQSKGKGSNSKGTSNGRANASKVKNSNQNRVNCEIESSNHVSFIFPCAPKAVFAFSFTNYNGYVHQVGCSKVMTWEKLWKVKLKLLVRTATKAIKRMKEKLLKT
ncbi:hypothetical protein H0E87_010698 [Populus deltoides]|nr:hypothetical protein H0E87_010698 [Populus deltoides]